MRARGRRCRIRERVSDTVDVVDAAIVEAPVPRLARLLRTTDGWNASVATTAYDALYFLIGIQILGA